MICQRSFPALFVGETKVEEAEYIKLIVQGLDSIFSELDETQRGSVKCFMRDVLRNGKIHNEEFLHRYLFHFWDDAWLSHHGAVAIREKFFKCNVSDSASRFGRSLVGRVYNRGEHIPDIIGIAGDSDERIYVIEIKNEPLDDRALGQILRYYQVVRNACDRDALYGNVKRVVPVLIVPDGGISFWDSVPFHFREVLEILYWRLNSIGDVVLVDGKSVLRRISGGRRFPSM